MTLVWRQVTSSIQIESQKCIWHSRGAPPASVGSQRSPGASPGYRRTRVPCCQCALSSAVRNAGVYCPCRIALYLRIGRYRFRTTRTTLCLKVAGTVQHCLLRLHVRTSWCSWARRAELVHPWAARAPAPVCANGKEGLAGEREARALCTTYHTPSHVTDCATAHGIAWHIWKHDSTAHCGWCPLRH